ncbi:protein kinase domain-containing protein [Actinomadura latina]|uniref:non-specific serine/threonine protein kinase n=1 Tax=Actinomadura latina TaxID=163603 RepID=A0A846Z9M4_9ACTN|nr:protein kinase [Actinomadura latina]NKZ07348.1 protein kinase [Actinomadura latina]
MRLTERYRLVERLDDGGTMEVWRARDELLDRPVAVKLLAPARAGLNPAFQEGVNRAAGLSHPALETIFDSDQTRDASGRLASYLVTEFLDGTTLADRLRRGPLTAYETADVCGRVAAALATAHAAGVAHGDLRPGKVVLLRDEVKLVDTGIGGVVRSARGPAACRTDVAQVPGGESEAADIRALGALISACVAPGASEDLPVLVARCLSQEPPSARQIADLLGREDDPPEQVFAARPAAAGPAPSQRTRTLRPPPPVRRHRTRPTRLAVAALCVAVPVTAAAAILVSSPRAPVTVPPPGRAESGPAPSRTAAPDTRPATGPAGTRVRGALGRLRPIVSRGYASGEIRSDVAIDLNNVITNLENDLTADRNVDVGRRVALLHDKIDTRRRERALTPGLADELNGVLATIQA